MNGIKFFIYSFLIAKNSLAVHLEVDKQFYNKDFLPIEASIDGSVQFIYKSFKEKGAIYPVQALNEQEVVTLQKNYLELCPHNSWTIPASERQFLHLKHKWVADLASHPKILSVVKGLLGPDMQVWTCDFSAKEPHSKGFFSWHQDAYYWNYDIADAPNFPIVTVWLSVFSSNQENGGVQIIPGSHKEVIPHYETQESENLLTKGQHADLELDQNLTQYMDLDAGEFSIHHPLTLHTSSPNTSEFPRVGLVVRYMSPSVVPPKRPAYAWLVSGKDTTGNWDHVAPAVESDSDQLIESCINSVKSFTGANYK